MRRVFGAAQTVSGGSGRLPHRLHSSSLTGSPGSSGQYLKRTAVVLGAFSSMLRSPSIA
ncbi:MAG TPA: hypothetical protein VF960_05985 [Chloroflexota bacterium]